MEQRTVKWLWETANHLDFTLPSAGLVSRHLRELSVCGQGVQGRLGNDCSASELCPQCLTPFSAGHYILRLVSSAKGKKRKQSLLKLLRRQPSSLNKYQVAFLNRIKEHPAKLLKIICLVCKKNTKIYLSKPGISYLERMQLKTVTESVNSSVNVDACEPVPTKGKKKKKRKKDVLCGLKKSAVSQVKNSKFQLPTSVSKTSNINKCTNQTSNVGLTLQKGSKSSGTHLPLVNTNKLIESHGKIKKSLVEIFSTIEKNDVCDSVNPSMNTLTDPKGLSVTPKNKSKIEFQHKKCLNSQINDTNNFNEPPKSDHSKEIVGCCEMPNNSPLRNKFLKVNSKRTGSKDINESVKKFKKSLDSENETFRELKLQDNVPSQHLRVSENLHVKIGDSVEQHFGKKVNLFSQPLSNSIIQSKIYTVSNNQSRNENLNSSRGIDNLLIKKPHNANIANKMAPKPKSNVSTNNQNTCKREKKKSKNKNGKKIKTSICDKVLDKSLSISDLLNLT